MIATDTLLLSLMLPAFKWEIPRDTYVMASPGGDPNRYNETLLDVCSNTASVTSSLDSQPHPCKGLSSRFDLEPPVNLGVFEYKGS